uniref:Uncharacterized protein n=1 Tax=Cacopsylla melanoneura TaxID=428564 RepID=A0A8D8SX91_9HEMI
MVCSTLQHFLLMLSPLIFCVQLYIQLHYPLCTTALPIVYFLIPIALSSHLVSFSVSFLAPSSIIALSSHLVSPYLFSFHSQSLNPFPYIILLSSLYKSKPLQTSLLFSYLYFSTLIFIIFNIDFHYYSTVLILLF